MNGELREKLEQRLKEKKGEYQKWWQGLSKERQDKYNHLRIVGARGNQEYQLYAYRQILDAIDKLVSADGKRVIPMALKLNGTVPYVYVQIEGHETPRYENMHEIWEVDRFTKEGRTKAIKADFDTTGFGIKAVQKEILEGLKSNDWTLEI